MYGSLSLAFVRVCACIYVWPCADAPGSLGHRQQICWQNAAAAVATSPFLPWGQQAGGHCLGLPPPGAEVS